MKLRRVTNAAMVAAIRELHHPTLRRIMKALRVADDEKRDMQKRLMGLRGVQRYCGRYTLKPPLA